MVELAVSLENGAELDLTNVDIGTSDGNEVLAFTVEGKIRDLESDFLETIAGKSLIPTEISFRIEETEPAS